MGEISILIFRDNIHPLELFDEFIVIIEKLYVIKTMKYF